MNTYVANEPNLGLLEVVHIGLWLVHWNPAVTLTFNTKSGSMFSPYDSFDFYKISNVLRFRSVLARIRNRDRIHCQPYEVREIYYFNSKIK